MEPVGLAQELLRLADEARAARERLRSLADEAARLRSTLTPARPPTAESEPAQPLDATP